jgi:hypothetical protein
MEKIKVIKDVISIDDANLIIDYIDKNLESFTSSPKWKRFQMMFGVDAYHGERSKPVIDGLQDITSLVKEHMDIIKKIISYEFDDQEEIFLSSLWLAKQIPGAAIKGHLDVDDGSNDHFVYSAVLYLNKVDIGGVLDFPKLGVSIKPEFGDLVVFPSIGEDMFHEVKTIGEDRYTLPMWFTKNKSLELPFK